MTTKVTVCDEVREPSETKNVSAAFPVAASTGVMAAVQLGQVPPHEMAWLFEMRTGLSET